MLKIVGAGVFDGPYEKCRRYSLAGIALLGIVITNCVPSTFSPCNMGKKAVYSTMENIEKER